MQTNLIRIPVIAHKFDQNFRFSSIQLFSYFSSGPFGQELCGHDAVRQRPPPGVCRTVVSFPPQKADDPGGREFLNALLRSSAGCTVRLAGGKRFPDPDVKANDTVLVNLETGKIENKCKFEVGAMLS